MEDLKEYATVHSKPLATFPNDVLFPSYGGKFSETKFCDCSIRIVVYEFCCILMIVCIDGLEHSSVEML